MKHCVCVCTCACVCVCMCVCACVYVCVCVCVGGGGGACECVCVCVCMYMCLGKYHKNIGNPGTSQNLYIQPSHILHISCYIITTHTYVYNSSENK